MEAHAGATRPKSDGARLEREWPGRERRRPRLWDGNYLLLSAIVESLEDARDRYVGRGAAILDVGADRMPYYPLFADIASDYAGADLSPGPDVRWVCTLEDLQAPDEAFDLVLCTQVLEHVRRPEVALRQIARVLRPGGHAFITTHGTYPFHPHPTDYWRWTQQGFEALFEDAGALELVELVPHRGTAACLAGLTSNYVEMAAVHARVGAFSRPVILALNALGLAGDRAFGRLRFPNEHTLVTNFLAVGKKPTSV
jgi:SAM-dependent methyltransferase